MWTEMIFLQPIFMGRINKLLQATGTSFFHLALSPQASPFQGSFAGAAFTLFNVQNALWQQRYPNGYVRY